LIENRSFHKSVRFLHRRCPILGKCYGIELGRSSIVVNQMYCKVWHLEVGWLVVALFFAIKVACMIYYLVAALTVPNDI